MYCQQISNDNIPWVEKYRPPTFNDIVLDEVNKELFNNILKTRYFPNLLFYGPPGTGKTTTIINLINKYNKKYYNTTKGSVIHLNASDERGIDVIRTQIYQFVKTNNIINNGLKFVILDEVDYMTKNAQYALKYLLQTSNYNVRFCLICNYISKLDDSLNNEFICIRFNQLPADRICNYIQTIILKENIKLSYENIQNIQKLYNSDIRSMINFIQLNKNMLSDKPYILSTEIWDNIHRILLNHDQKENVYNIINEYVHELSILYNIDKPSILIKYFNYVIRTHNHLLSKEFFLLLEVILHTTEINIHSTIQYISNNICTIYQTSIKLK